MQHDREVLDRQRQVDRENELMADYLTELDRAARSSSTDELDRRYRGLLAGISQEDLDYTGRLLREQGWTSEQQRQPQNVARRLFDDDDDDELEYEDGDLTQNVRRSLASDLSRWYN